MKLTIIHPSIGRPIGQKYIKTWQMEPLPAAAIAGLTPEDVEIAFYDDRMEAIPFNEPTDLVAISIETYTAKRSYQIASEYRKRDIPVVMGGFHATLCPEEVSQYSEAVVIGEADEIWKKVLLDAEQKTLKPYYKSAQRPSLRGSTPDRSIFQGKRYLPLGLVEAARGCIYSCDFCAIQTAFGQSQNYRSLDSLEQELRQLKKRLLLFFVDDNISANMVHAKAFLRMLIPLKLRWVSQMSINAAYDEEYLQLLVASGCQGVLIGFESINPINLMHMKKGFSISKGNYDLALKNLRKFGIKLYATFIFGYDEDTSNSFVETLRFAKHHKFYIAAFNHLTPFPGTPLYKRLHSEGRLRFNKWWLDERYSYNMIPFTPVHMSPDQLQEGCVNARIEYYQWNSILNRSLDKVNANNSRMWLSFFWINYLIRREVRQRNYYPLGDMSWEGDLLQVRQRPLPIKDNLENFPIHSL